MMGCIGRCTVNSLSVLMVNIGAFYHVRTILHVPQYYMYIYILLISHLITHELHVIFRALCIWISPVWRDKFLSFDFCDAKCTVLYIHVQSMTCR